MIKRITEQPGITWDQLVVSTLLSGQPVLLKFLYYFVEAHAPGFVASDPQWKDKVRRLVERLDEKGLVENMEDGVWQATANYSEAHGDDANNA